MERSGMEAESLFLRITVMSLEVLPLLSWFVVLILFPKTTNELELLGKLVS